MTEQQISQALEAQLRAVAPEADLAALDRRAPLRDALDLDSMDFLKVVVGLHRALGVEIPEADYRKLASFDASVAYLLGRLDGRP